MELPDNHQRLMELVGRVRDGGLDDSQTAELERILDGDPEALKYYVEAVDVATMLHRQQGLVAQRSDVVNSRTSSVASEKLPERSTVWSTARWALAVCASLTIGTLFGAKLLPTDDAEKRITASPYTLSDPQGFEIATLSFASGCRWETNERTRFEGQRLTDETLRLEEGVAVVQFDSDVRLVMEGPACLDLARVDRAMLRFGKVVFSGSGDLERFTLETPFSTIKDEGTEYAVSVDRSSKVGEVHVFDGKAICEPSEATSSGTPYQLIEIDAGDARRFSTTGNVESIALASTRFVREPTVQRESLGALLLTDQFTYDTEAIDGQSGGFGWDDAWTIASRLKDDPGAWVNTKESLVWPGSRIEPGTGSLMIRGSTGISRRIKHPIRMDRDVAWYLSFLVRRQSVPEGAKSAGWAYLTFRESETKSGHVSVGPVTHPGAPRVMHDGRVANSAVPLREDVAYLFVCKILARQDKGDEVKVRIYGDHETVDSVEPSVWNIRIRPVHSDAVLNEVRLSAKNSAPIQFDELRIGTTWSGVTLPYTD